MSALPSRLYVNVYPPFAGQIGVAYPTRALADQMAGRGRLACIELDLVSGTAAVVGNDAPLFVDAAE